jgi:hypothetical protein
MLFATRRGGDREKLHKPGLVPHIYLQISRSDPKSLARVLPIQPVQLCEDERTNKRGTNNHDD